VTGPLKRMGTRRCFLRPSLRFCFWSEAHLEFVLPYSWSWERILEASTEDSHSRCFRNNFDADYAESLSETLLKFEGVERGTGGKGGVKE
jgi:hypothetical protein